MLSSDPTGETMKEIHAWRRSSRCQHADCVEVAVLSDGVLIRDSKLGESGPTLTFTIEQFKTFIQAAKTHEPPRIL
jgi:hypothetical protein